jgi:hypothetical protein
MIELNKITKKDLVRITKAISVLDAIISPEWEYRYYSFNSKWSKDESMASMRDGQGNCWFLLITEKGMILSGHIKGQKSELNLQEGVPNLFIDNFWNEPAFMNDEANFIAWKLDTDKCWSFKYGTDNTIGVQNIINLLRGNPEDYKEFAQEYYEKELDIKIVKQIYTGEKITIDMLQDLNNEITLNEIENDLREIGYGEFA